MSWSHYQVYANAEAAKKAVAELKEPTPEQNYGTPPAAKQLMLTAIDLCGITPSTSPDYLVGVKIEASGHSPGGICQVKVEPFTIKL